MTPDPSLLEPLYAFNRWANEAIREALNGAGEEMARTPLDLWFGSVFAITAHLCSAEQVWLARLRGDTAARPATADDFPTLDALIAAWREADAAWEAYVATLTPATLAEEISVTLRSGQRPTFARWQIATYVPLHSTEHRAQAALGLTKLGVQHGPQDFILQFMPPA